MKYITASVLLSFLNAWQHCTRVAQYCVKTGLEVSNFYIVADNYNGQVVIVVRTCVRLQHYEDTHVVCVRVCLCVVQSLHIR